MTHSRPHPLRDAALAVSLLTVIPTAATWPEGERTDVAGWLPLGGIVVGLVSFGISLGAMRLDLTGSQPLLFSALALLALALMTRFLHHDGLADVADAWWGGETQIRRLEIMKDSATGAFGVTAVCFATVVSVAAVSELLASGVLWPLLVGPPVARGAATFASWFGSPARAGGLGRSIIGSPRLGAIVPFLLILCAVTYVAWLMGGVTGVALCGLGVALALVVPHLISLRMGGVTGDVMGAAVLLVETALYVTAAVVMAR